MKRKQSQVSHVKRTKDKHEHKKKLRLTPTTTKTTKTEPEPAPPAAPSRRTALLCFGLVSILEQWFSLPRVLCSLIQEYSDHRIPLSIVCDVAAPYHRLHTHLVIDHAKDRFALVDRQTQTAFCVDLQQGSIDYKILNLQDEKNMQTHPYIWESCIVKEQSPISAAREICTSAGQRFMRHINMPAEGRLAASSRDGNGVFITRRIHRISNTFKLIERDSICSLHFQEDASCIANVNLITALAYDRNYAENCMVAFLSRRGLLYYAYHEKPTHDIADYAFTEMTLLQPIQHPTHCLVALSLERKALVVYDPMDGVFQWLPVVLELALPQKLPPEPDAEEAELDFEATRFDEPIHRQAPDPISIPTHFDLNKKDQKLVTQNTGNARFWRGFALDASHKIEQDEFALRCRGINLKLMDGLITECYKRTTTLSPEQLDEALCQYFVSFRRTNHKTMRLEIYDTLRRKARKAHSSLCMKGHIPFPTTMISGRVRAGIILQSPLVCARNFCTNIRGYVYSCTECLEETPFRMVSDLIEHSHRVECLSCYATSERVQLLSLSDLVNGKYPCIKQNDVKRYPTFWHKKEFHTKKNYWSCAPCGSFSVYLLLNTQGDGTDRTETVSLACADCKNSVAWDSKQTEGVQKIRTRYKKFNSFEWNIKSKAGTCLSCRSHRVRMHEYYHYKLICEKCHVQYSIRSLVGL